MKDHRAEVITVVYCNVHCQSKTFKRTSIPPSLTQGFAKGMTLNVFLKEFENDVKENNFRIEATKYNLVVLIILLTESLKTVKLFEVFMETTFNAFSHW